jgi:Xaa-Pro aminopeptidase
MAAAAGLLARSEPAADGELQVGGRPLLAEDVRATLRRVCAEHGAPCPPDITVASVWQGEGHEPGSGPLPAGLPIHVDIWPRHEESACWSDMARTFLVGDPVPEHAEKIAEFEHLVLAALENARAAVRPGVTGRELYDATCDAFEAAGYPTQRNAEADGSLDGFRHSLGHGVGLEVHEAPALGVSGHEPLVPGDVIAIEPGLWDSRFGGVTFEDLVLVTDDGAELLTQFPYDLRPSG